MSHFRWKLSGTTVYFEILINKYFFLSMSIIYSQNSKNIRSFFIFCPILIHLPFLHKTQTPIFQPEFSFRDLFFSDFFMSQTVEQWFQTMPPVTKSIFLAITGTTLLTAFGVLDPYLLFLDFDIIFTKFQVCSFIF